MTRSNGQQALNKARRSHTKSRDGCRNCKKRRIKCDESRPCCQKCEAFGVKCDFPQATSILLSSDGGSPLPSTLCSQDSTKGRGRPRKGWDANALPVSNALLSTISSSGFRGISNMDELELMLQYTNSTARTIAQRGKILQMWQSAIPNLGLKHPFLLELLLALAALHLARVCVQRRVHFLTLAGRYQAAGLRNLTTAIAGLNPSNRVAIYVSTILTCYLHLGKGPTPGDCLVFNKDGPALWFTMFRGIRSVEELSLENGFGTLLKDIDEVEEQEDHELHQDLQSSTIRFQWSDVFEHLREHLRLSNAPEADIYFKSLTSLADVYKKTFGAINAEPLRRNETEHLPFAWLYGIDDVLVQSAQEQESIPMIVVSLFALLLRRLDKLWWLEGWAEHIVRSVHAMLPTDYYPFIDWQMQQFGSS